MGQSTPSRSPQSRPAWLLLLLAAVVLAACAGPGRSAVKRYGAALDDSTRSDTIYSGIEARAYLYATYKTPGFRRAYIERYLEEYDLDEDYREALIASEDERSARTNEFFIALYTPEDEWNDLDRKDSVWKLYLEDSSGARLTPLSITKVDGRDPLIREFFPFFDLWSSAYTVEFPKYSAAGLEPFPGKEAESMRLIITGPLGRGELTWRLGR